MVKYRIYFIGEGLKEVKTKEDASYHLAAKYGIEVYNKAVKMGIIVFTENYVKVSPFNVEEKLLKYRNGSTFTLTPIHTSLK